MSIVTMVSAPAKPALVNIVTIVSIVTIVTPPAQPALLTCQYLTVQYRAVGLLVAAKRRNFGYSNHGDCSDYSDFIEYSDLSD